MSFFPPSLIVSIYGFYRLWKTISPEDDVRTSPHSDRASVEPGPLGPSVSGKSEGQKFNPQSILKKVLTLVAGFGAGHLVSGFSSRCPK